MNKHDLFIKMSDSWTIAALGMQKGLVIAFITLLAMPSYGAEKTDAVDGDELLIEEGVSEELSVEEGDTDELVIEDGDETSTDLTESSEGMGQDELVIEDEASDETLTIDEPEQTAETLSQEHEQKKDIVGAQDSMAVTNSSFGVDELWVEYASIPDSNSNASGQVYIHAKATASWRPSNSWEFQLAGRIDGYEQVGGRSLGDVRLDYGESFVRYRTEQLRLTIGTQKVIWGRIDEAPPTDRMSTQDFSRYIVDDLADRRRANPAIRYEHFFQNHKLDLVYLPRFRAAELPDQESIWYPVNRLSGENVGIKSTPANVALIKSVPIDDDAPTSDGGLGARFSGQSDGLDYALTIQKSRQSIPYYAFNSDRGVLETKYPRSWVLGGDFGFEAMDATWRFEAAWFSDTPITGVSGNYSTTESISWGAGVELFPGDGDARLTIQLTGQNLINASDILDRREIVLINGSFEVPFADNQWRAKARFYFGIDERDIYFNPELAYTGWDAQEIYIEGHYFDGAEGTPGGFHQNNSLIALGWRIKF